MKSFVRNNRKLPIEEQKELLDKELGRLNHEYVHGNFRTRKMTMKWMKELLRESKVLEKKSLRSA